MSDFDGEMNKLFGGNRANYTVEDIERAKKRQKKCGGTLYENLSAITGERTGQKPLAPIMGSSSSSQEARARIISAAHRTADIVLFIYTRIVCIDYTSCLFNGH